MIVFQKIKLNDALDKLIDYRGKTPKKTKMGIPLITAKIVKDGFINEPTEFIAESEYKQWMTRGFPEKGDVLLTVEAPLGEVAQVKNTRIALAQRIVTLRGKKGLLDNDFLKYYLISPVGQSKLRERGSGTTVVGIKQSELRQLQIDIPDILIQELIASVISTYDRLIKNNERRIQIFEEMAQRLYAEWFVKFNFPGHEKTRIIDSPLGRAPADWKVKRIDEVAKVIRGTSYSTEEIDELDGDFYLVNLKSFNRGGGFRFDGVKYFNGNVKDEQLLKRGDIVVAVTDMTTDRAVISRPARIPNIRSKKITFSADVVKIVPKEIPLAFAYYSLLDYRFTESTKNKANGANVLHLKPGAISEYKMLLPDKKLLDQFERMCINVVELQDNLSEQNEMLVKMRNLLIPQLITGKRELKNSYGS